MLYIDDNLHAYSDAEVERLIAALPQQRREQACKYRHLQGRKESVLAYQLLCKGLQEEYGIVELPTFVYGAHGKPAIAGREEIHFNMSHCRQAVMCYVSDTPVGIDCEVIGRGNEPLIDYTMSEAERRQIHAAASPMTEFIRLWTQKEAVLKLTGEGINDDLKSVLAPEHLQGIRIETVVNAAKGYAYSVAQYIEGERE